MTKEFGESFLGYMERSGFTSQRELARKTGVSKSTIQHVIRGERGLSQDMSIRLADVFSIFERNARIEFNMLSAGYSIEYINSVLGKSSPRFLEKKTSKIREIRRKRTTIKITTY